MKDTVLTEKVKRPLALHLDPAWDSTISVCLLFLIVLAILYWPGFYGDWHYDDYFNILHNKNVQIDSLDTASLKKSLYIGDPQRGGRLQRPLAYLSFALNYYFGQDRVLGYHIVNFTIHLLTSIFLYFFIKTTLNLPKLKSQYKDLGHCIALLSAFIWAIHPIHVTAVTYIVQRMASMAGLFYVGALFFYAKGRTVESPTSKWFCFAGVAISAMLAMATKQNSAMLPVSIVLYEWILVQGVDRMKMKRVFMLGLPALAILFFAGWLYINPDSFLDGYAKTRPYTSYQRIMTEPRVIWYYLGQLIYPTQSRLMLLHDIDFSTSPWAPWTTMPSIIGWIVIFLGAVTWGARKHPLIAYAMVFFLVNHAIEGSFLNLELIYEHRNYIPSMLVFIFPSILVVRLLMFFSYANRFQWVLAAGIAMILAVVGHTTYGYNGILRNDRWMWADNISKSPRLSLVHNNYGSRLWTQGIYDKALDAFIRAMDADRYVNLLQKGMVHYNIGLYYAMVANDHQTALGYYEKALKWTPNNRKIWLEYAKSKVRGGDLGAGETILRQKLKKWPEDHDMITELSSICLKKGALDEGAELIRIARRQHSWDLTALAVDAEISRRLGRIKRAVMLWKQFHQRLPEDVRARFALMEVYHDDHQPQRVNHLLVQIVTAKKERTWNQFLAETSQNRSESDVYIPSKERLFPIIESALENMSGEVEKISR